MNSAGVVSVLAMIVFLVAASTQMFLLVKSMGVKDVELSLILRSVVVGLTTYVLYSLLL
jgi:uncharacterized protein with PQ loop repeat